MLQSLCAKNAGCQVSPAARQVNLSAMRAREATTFTETGICFAAVGLAGNGQIPPIHSQFFDALANSGEV